MPAGAAHDARVWAFQKIGEGIIWKTGFLAGDKAIASIAIFDEKNSPWDRKNPYPLLLGFG